MKNNPLSLRKEELLYENLYKGKYVTIYPLGVPKTFTGMFKEIIRDIVILQPGLISKHNKEGKMEIYLKDEPITIPLQSVGPIIPETEESILNYCESENKAQEAKNINGSDFALNKQS